MLKYEIVGILLGKMKELLNVRSSPFLLFWSARLHELASLFGLEFSLQIYTELTGWDHEDFQLCNVSQLGKWPSTK
jgi:hypothetical protein